MTCERCKGQMVKAVPLQFHAQYADLSEDKETPCWSCPICGNYVDPVILSNRATQSIAA